MREDFQAYFDDIGVSRVVADRVQHFLDTYERIVPGLQFDGVFIANAEDEENRPVLKSLWFWNATHLFECHDFQTQEILDSMEVVSSLYWRVTANSYSIGQVPTPASRLQIILKFPHAIAGELSATGTNCGYLAQFFQSRLLLRTQQSLSPAGS